MTDWSTLKKLIWLRIIKGGGSAVRTVKGAIVHVINALARPAISVKCEVNPIQDLHGYDNPWPSGGGKNKFDSSLMADASTGAEFITLNLKPNTAYTMSSDDPCKDNGTIMDLFFCNMDESVSSGTNGVKLNKSITRTSDANGQLRAGYRCYEGWITPEQLIAYHTQVEEGSTPTAWTPFSNICPISGRTSATVTRTGRNLLGLNSDNFDSAGPNVTVDYLQTGVRVNNSIAYANTNARWVIHGLAKMLSGKAVNLSFNVNTSSDNTGGYIVRTQTNGTVVTNYIRSNTNIAGGTFINTSFTIPNDGAEDICFIFYAVGRTTPSSGDTAYTEYTNIQLELGSTATAYEPYQGNTYTIQLGDTVYGGTLDVTGGKMVVDRAELVPTALKQGAYAAVGRFYPWIALPFPSVDYSQGFCNKLKCARTFSQLFANVSFMVRQEYLSLNLSGAGYESAVDAIAAGNAFIANNDVQFVYPLAQPIEITLTPTQIDMLLGENNLWADAGDLTLTYYADGNASTSEALGILLGGTYNNPGGADDVSDDEALGILLGGS